MNPQIANAAQLALAAYGVLQNGETRLQLDALRRADFTDRQAEEFARGNPAVLAQFNDAIAEGGMGTGLSATLFKDAAGNLTLAIRGTDRLSPGSGSDLGTGLDIVTKGAAYDQIVALSNWWRRVSAPAGTRVAQHRIGSYASDAVPAGAVALDSGSQVRVLEDAPSVAAASDNSIRLALTESNGRIDLTGHSLGGHLSMAFSTMFSSVSGGVTVFNAPGFVDDETNRAFFGKLGGSIPTSSAILNVAADEALLDFDPFNWIAGRHSRPGQHINVTIESQTSGDEPAPFGARNHSIVALTDSLAVYRLLSDLSPALTPEAYRAILNRADRFSHAGYERVVDALGALLVGSATPLKTGNGNRNDLYSVIYDLQRNPAYINALALVQIAPTPDMAPDLFLEAGSSTEQGLAHRYALANLNPFVLIDGGNLGVYARYKPGGANAGELDLYGADSNPQGLTSAYLEDRAAFLERKLYLTGLDRDQHYHVRASTDPLPNPPDARGQAYYAEQKHYEDRASGFVASRGDTRDLMQHFVFGGASSDVIQGAARDDRLYGGAGDDFITGGRGNDYLEGGLGFDIYMFSSGDGVDTIFDADGDMQLVHDGRPVALGIRQADGTWKLDDTSFRRSDSGTDLEITFAASEDRVVVRNFDFSLA
jgi:Ca2+-binding RTX toxin-like protein